MSCDDSLLVDFSEPACSGGSGDAAKPSGEGQPESRCSLTAQFRLVFTSSSLEEHMSAVLSSATEEQHIASEFAPFGGLGPASSCSSFSRRTAGDADTPAALFTTTLTSLSSLAAAALLAALTQCGAGHVDCRGSTGFGGRGGGLGLGASLSGGDDVTADDVTRGGAPALTASEGEAYSSGTSLGGACSLRGWPSKLREEAEVASLGGRGGGSGRERFSGIVRVKFNIIDKHSAASSAVGGETIGVNGGDSGL